MSGHSKWSTIKRQKGKTDAARGKIFTKIGREIAVAVKQAGADPATNSKLRDTIVKARNANMPNDNIARSIKKASGELNLINYEEIIYEGYGPSGSAVIVETLTDNKNRTAGDVRHIFDKAGGAMGTNGCVSYMFESKGVIVTEKKPGLSDDDVLLIALECGAEDIAISEDGYEIICMPAEFAAVRENIEKNNIKVVDASVDKIPGAYIEIDAASLPKFFKMLDAFEENDDVQNVYHNVELPDN